MRYRSATNSHARARHPVRIRDRASGQVVAASVRCGQTHPSGQNARIPADPIESNSLIQGIICPLLVLSREPGPLNPFPGKLHGPFAPTPQYFNAHRAGEKH